MVASKLSEAGAQPSCLLAFMEVVALLLFRRWWTGVSLYCSVQGKCSQRVFVLEWNVISLVRFPVIFLMCAYTYKTVCIHVSVHVYILMSALSWQDRHQVARRSFCFSYQYNSISSQKA